MLYFPTPAALGAAVGGDQFKISPRHLAREKICTPCYHRVELLTICLVVFTQYQRVTDRQTHRQTDRLFVIRKQELSSN